MGESVIVLSLASEPTLVEAAGEIARCWRDDGRSPLIIGLRGELGSGKVMCSSSFAGNGQVMEEGGGVYDFTVRAFGLRDAQPQLRYSENMVNVVGYVAGQVQLPDLRFAQAVGDG